MSTLSLLLTAFRPFMDRLSNRMLPKPSVALPLEKKLKFGRNLRDELKENNDPVYLEMLGEAVFLAYVPGHVLREILEKSPSPKLDVEAFLRGRRLIAPRLVDGRIALKHEPSSSNVSLLTFLLLAAVSVVAFSVGIAFLLKQPTEWRRILIPLVVGFVSAAGAWEILRSDLEACAARDLVHSLYPPTQEDKARVEEVRREGRKKGWKALFWGICVVFVLAVIQRFFGNIVIGGVIGASVAALIILAAWRDFYPEKQTEAVENELS